MRFPVNEVSLCYWCCFIIAGLSPELTTMEQVRRVMRPTDVPDQGLLCDLLWADPDRDVIGWGQGDRGVSFCFGPDIVSNFLQKHNMDLVCRAHQVGGVPGAGILHTWYHAVDSH